jgi:hypothetical protein
LISIHFLNAFGYTLLLEVPLFSTSPTYLYELFERFISTLRVISPTQVFRYISILGEPIENNASMLYPSMFLCIISSDKKYDTTS